MGIVEFWELDDRDLGGIWGLGYFWVWKWGDGGGGLGVYYDCCYPVVTLVFLWCAVYLFFKMFFGCYVALIMMWLTKFTW